MATSGVSQAGVRAATAEYEQLGREELRRRYGFDLAAASRLVLEGKSYDPLAIFSLAQRYELGRWPTPEELTGGEEAVAKLLDRAGFVVEFAAAAEAAPLPRAPQLVLQPRGRKPSARQHFTHTMCEGVPLAQIEKHLDDDLAVMRTLYPSGTVWLWGSTPCATSWLPKRKAQEGCRAGDDVFFYHDGHFIARARILHLMRNRGLAAEMWGVDEDGQTWEHVMALGSVEHFKPPVSARPVLNHFNLGTSLRSLTLKSASDYASAASLFPGGPGPGGMGTEPVDAADAAGSALRDRMAALNMRGEAERAASDRSESLALLWAASRIAKGKPRLSPLPRLQEEMSPLLTEFGGPGGESSARGFQWLRVGELWEFRDNFEGDSVAARSVENGEPPLVGLALPAAEILTRAEARLETVVTLSRGALADVDQSRLLHRTGLGGYENAQGESDDTREPDTTLIPVQRVAEAGQATGPAGRRQGRYSRIIRNSAFAQRVKELHEGTCQVCGTTLEHGGRSFVQAAHIQGLGDPHNGPDVLSNLLCLCPNDHALFDGFALYIDERWTVRTQEGVSLGTLRRVPQHTIDTSYVAYHRRLCALSTSATRR